MGNKIALITGGSRGLGKDMALSIARKGIDVIITYNENRTAAGEVVDELRRLNVKAEALQLDVGQVGSLSNFASSVGALLQEKWNTKTLDFLVNNAGIGATIPFLNVTEDDFDRLMNIHYKGAFFLTQKVLPIMNDHGAVIFVSSGTTRFCVPGYSVYASLKGALEVLTRYIAKEFGSRGIRSNIVAPGPVETDFNNAAIRNNPQMKAALGANTALGRVGQAEDIGGVVAFLCTDEGRWINAQRIEVSGGTAI